MQRVLIYRAATVEQAEQRLRGNRQLRQPSSVLFRQSLIKLNTNVWRSSSCFYRE